VLAGHAESTAPSGGQLVPLAGCRRRVARWRRGHVYRMLTAWQAVSTLFSGSMGLPGLEVKRADSGSFPTDDRQ